MRGAIIHTTVASNGNKRIKWKCWWGRSEGGSTLESGVQCWRLFQTLFLNENGRGEQAIIIVHTKQRRALTLCLSPVLVCLYPDRALLFFSANTSLIFLVISGKNSEDAAEEKKWDIGGWERRFEEGLMSIRRDVRVEKLIKTRLVRLRGKLRSN